MPKECPDCGQQTVTLTPDEGTILGHPIEHFVLTAEHDDELRIRAYCWECEWEQKKTISIEVTL